MRRILSLTVVFVAVISSLADAGTRTWTGTVDGRWSVAANWGGTLPDPADQLLFPVGAPHRTMVNDFPAYHGFYKLIFEDAYTVSGAAMQISNGGIQVVGNGTTTVIIQVPISLAASQTWSTGAAFLTIAGGVDLNFKTLTIQTSMPLTISGVIDGVGQIIKTGTSSLRLTANNAYYGQTIVNDGVLEVMAPNALGIADGTEANGTFLNKTPATFSGGVLQLDSVVVANEALVVDSFGYLGPLKCLGDSSYTGPITLKSPLGIDNLSGTLTLAGPISGPSGIDVYGGSQVVLAYANNSFTGPVSAPDAGKDGRILRVDAPNAIPASATVAFSQAITLMINKQTQVLDSITGDAHLDLPTANSVLSLTGAKGGPITSFNGTITGTGVFHYGGTRRLNVTTSSNGFTGKFMAASGTLRFSGSSNGAAMAMPGGRFELTSLGTKIGPIAGGGGTISILSPVTAVNGGGNAVQLSSGSTLEFPVQSAKLNTLTAVGGVALGGSSLSLVLDSAFKPVVPVVGAKLTLIANDGTDPVLGTFAGLPEGSTFAMGASLFRITYAGGTNNNDVVLTVVDSREYLLSEGATGSFFTTDLLLANPNDVAVPLYVTFLKDDGTTVGIADTLAPMSHKMIRVNDVPGMASAAFSTVVSSKNGLPLAVERTMSWDRSGYGAHTEHATDGAATTWLFAEGSQGFFHTYLLLTNPQLTSNVAHVDYLIEGGTVVNRTYALTSSSRLTVDVGSDAELVNKAFGMAVHFDQPGGAERAMYFGEAPLFNGGHESAGVTAPSTTWFLAEGATGPFFETFVLLANANDAEASVTVTYLPSAGAPITAQKTVPAHGRLTINLETENPALANAAVSTQIVSSLPIVVERSQYWPDPAPQWYEAHNSFGVTELATKWALAEGRVGAVDGIGGAQTYILLANPGTSAAQVSITFLRDSATPVTKVFTVPPTSRFNVAVGPGTDVPELTNEHFGALITADQPIAVERALYWDANGQVWAAGTNATATRLP